MAVFFFFEISHFYTTVRNVSIICLLLNVKTEKYSDCSEHIPTQSHFHSNLHSWIHIMCLHGAMNKCITDGSFQADNVYQLYHLSIHNHLTTECRFNTNKCYLDEGKKETHLPVCKPETVSIN